MRRALVLLAGLASVGCGAHDADIRAHRAAVQRAALLHQLDELGDRLVVDAARVRHWRELRARREVLSPVAYATELVRESAPDASRRYVERALALSQPAGLAEAGAIRY